MEGREASEGESKKKKLEGKTMLKVSEGNGR